MHILRNTPKIAQKLHAAIAHPSSIYIPHHALLESLTMRRDNGISRDLRVHDLRQPLPFGDRQFDHAVTVGVFHFIKDVGILVRETSRVIKLAGIFGYTTFSPEDESQDVSEQRIHGFLIYQHSHRLMDSVLGKLGFEVLKTTRFTYYSDPSKGVEVTNRIYVARYVWEYRCSSTLWRLGISHVRGGQPVRPATCRQSQQQPGKTPLPGYRRILKKDPINGFPKAPICSISRCEGIPSSYFMRG